MATTDVQPVIIYYSEKMAKYEDFTTEFTVEDVVSNLGIPSIALIECKQDGKPLPGARQIISGPLTASYYKIVPALAAQQQIPPRADQALNQNNINNNNNAQTGGQLAGGAGGTNTAVAYWLPKYLRSRPTTQYVPDAVTRFGYLLPFQTSSRKKALSRLWNAFVTHYDSYCAGSDERLGHPIPFVYGTPGVGKTRFGIEAVKQLLAYAKSEKLDHPGLLQALQECVHNNVDLHITFANGTSFNKAEKEDHPQSSVAARMLYSYFQPDQSFDTFLNDPFGIGRVLDTLSVQDAINCIRVDRRLEAKERLCLYLNIDEFNECVTHSTKRTSKDQPKFFHDMVDSIAELMSAKQQPTLMFVLWTGTAFEAMINYGVSSKHTIVEIPLPLLSDIDIFGDFSDLQNHPGLLDELAKLPRFIWLRNWYKNIYFRRGISDAGGLGRAIEFILFEADKAAYGGHSPSKYPAMVPALLDKLDMSSILNKAHDKIDERYKVMTRAGPYAVTLLCDALLHNSVVRTQVVKPNVAISDPVTYEKLEGYGAVILHDTTSNGVTITTVELPFIWLRWLVLKAGQTIPALSQWHLLQSPCATFNHEDWEIFAGEYAVLRNNLLESGEEKVASFRQLFSGALGHKDLMDMKVSLRSLSFVETREQFLVSTLSPTNKRDGYPVEWTNLSKLVKPAANEPSIDLVSIWRLADNTGHVLLLTQCRWTYSSTKRITRLSPDVLTNLYSEAIHMVAMAAQKCEDGTPESILFRTCRIVFCVITPKPYVGAIPQSCFVISKDQFKEYFGKAFYSRAVFNMVQPSHVNFAEVCELERLPGVGGAVLKAIIEEREQRPFLDMDEFVERVGKERHIAAIITRHYKALEMELLFD